jgi:hypothetical protein
MAQVMHWKTRWLVGVTAAMCGILFVLVTAIAYGEFDLTWLIALVITVLFVAGFAAVVEYVRWRLATRRQRRSTAP